MNVTRIAQSERELWDPDTQAIDREILDRRLAEGLAREWQRVWSHPLPFYRERYEAAGLGPDEVPALDRIPRTTKEDLRAEEAANPPFGRHRAVTIEQAARIAQTTGTTGRPWLIFYTADDLDRMLEMQYQHNWRLGLRPGSRFTHSWPGGMYPTGVLGGRHFLNLGVLELAVGPPFSPQEAEAQIQLWQLLEPDALMTTGSQLQIYEQAAERLGVDLAELLDGWKLAFLEASCQFEGPRRRVEEAYGVRLHNISGAAEVPGFVSSDCRFHTGLHAPNGTYVIQACDPETGVEVAPGERGTLVMTTVGLDVFRMRYDLDDIVVVHEGPCPCGQTGRRYTLIGRAADRAVVDDKMILPLDIQLGLVEWGAPEFVLEAGEHGAVRVRIEAGGAGEEMGRALSGHLDVDVEVEEVEVGSLPRSTFKPRRIGK